MILSTWMTRAAMAVTLLAIPSGALASPYSEVASALDEDDRFDVHMSLDYGFELHQASILREFAGLPGALPTDPLPLVNDLTYSGSRHVVTPRLEIGVLPDLAVTMALPLVLSGSATLSLADNVGRDNSTTIRDAILPDNGFDADNPGGAGFTSGNMLFRGPSRSGIDQIHLGLTWAAMNQARDATKPTWKLGIEPRVAIGAPMRLNPTDPGSESSVGRGLHEVRIWTSFARRFGFIEPFVELWWLAPFAETDDSAFQDLGFGQRNSGAQQRGGTVFGAEVVVWQQPASVSGEESGAAGKGMRVVVDASAHLEANFEGRAYTEMWEVFQYAGTPKGDPTTEPLVLDANPAQDGRQDLIHPGITAVENYLRYGGQFRARAELATTPVGDIDFGASFGLLYSQPHLITFADAGVDFPTCGPGVSEPCEDDENGVVDPGTAEVNPGHVSVIDFIGGRYRVDDVFDYVIRIEARILF